MSERPLYSSRIMDTYTKYLKKNYPHVNTDAILAKSGIKAYQVADEEHWFTQSEVDRFYAEVEKATGNRDVAREAGRFSASSNSLGLIRHFVLGQVGPGRAYEMFGTFALLFDLKCLSLRDYCTRTLDINGLHVNSTEAELRTASEGPGKRR